MWTLFLNSFIFSFIVCVILLLSSFFLFGGVFKESKVTRLNFLTVTNKKWSLSFDTLIILFIPFLIYLVALFIANSLLLWFYLANGISMSIYYFYIIMFFIDFLLFVISFLGLE
jgi:hypothetical protein